MSQKKTAQLLADLRMAMIQALEQNPQSFYLLFAQDVWLHKLLEQHHSLDHDDNDVHDLLEFTEQVEELHEKVTLYLHWKQKMSHSCYNSTAWSNFFAQKMPEMESDIRTDWRDLSGGIAQWLTAEEY